MTQEERNSVLEEAAKQAVIIGQVWIKDAEEVEADPSSTTNLATWARVIGGACLNVATSIREMKRVG